MHFYFAHGKYQDSIKSYFYTLLTLMTGLGSPISFSASHRQHHAFVDTPKDPHSPYVIGWKRVYFLQWEPQVISPRLLADYARSKFQKVVHANWFNFHITIIAVLAIIDPRLVCFMLSPFVMYSFHAAGTINCLAHLDGNSNNVRLLKIFNYWGWRHGDHHNFKK